LEEWDERGRKGTWACQKTQIPNMLSALHKLNWIMQLVWATFIGRNPVHLFMSALLTFNGRLKCVLHFSFCQYTCFFLARNSDLIIKDIATCYLFFNVFHQQALRHLPPHGFLLLKDAYNLEQVYSL
jgi:hypothetical protein